MKTISRTVQMLAAVGLAAMLQLSQAVASPIVSIVPADQTINAGDPASIDIIVSGLTVSVGGFSFILTFNDIIVSGTAYLNDPDGKMGAAPADFSLGFAGGTLDIFFVADATETETTLADSQGASFRLARVDFLGIANGLSLLTLSDVVLSNSDGTLYQVPQPQNGRICVGGNCNVVPEPATLLLVAGALGALGMIRRRRHAA